MLAELASMFLCWAVMEYLDRRKVFMGFSFITAISIIAAALFKEGDNYQCSAWKDCNICNFKKCTPPLLIHQKRNRSGSFVPGKTHGIYLVNTLPFYNKLTITLVHYAYQRRSKVIHKYLLWD